MMHLFQILCRDIPEFHPLKVALAVLRLLEDDEQEFGRCKKVIERRLFPRFVHHRTEIHPREGHILFDTSIYLHSDGFRLDACLLEFLCVRQMPFHAKHRCH